MAPRRRPRAEAEAAPPSLASLPDELILRCLEPLSLEERCAPCSLPSAAAAATALHLPATCIHNVSSNHAPRRLRSVALVSERFRALCMAPQLLASLEVSICGSGNVLPRSAALLQFLLANAAHVQELNLAINSADDDDDDDAQLSDSQQQELAANVASSLAVCSAAGTLRLLDISEETPLASTAWLPALWNLQQLKLGDRTRALHLPAAFSSLTALADATLYGSPLVLEGPLPFSVTRLCLIDSSSAELPRQVRNDRCPALASAVSLLVAWRQAVMPLHGEHCT